MLLAGEYLNTTQHKRPSPRLVRGLAVLVWLVLLTPLGAFEGPPGGIPLTPEQRRQENLMPRPTKVFSESGVLEWHPRWNVVWGEVPEDWLPDLGKRLAVVAEQAHVRLVTGEAPGTEVLDVELRYADVGSDGPLVREGYELTVGAMGILLLADSREGFFYGLITLQQLLPPIEILPLRAQLPWGTIVDRPRYGWRGLMLDSSRHFLPVSTLEAVLEQMALHKLNRFHWHLSDDQGWRLEVPGWPRLTSVGARRTEVDGSVTEGFYTEADVHRIVDFARERQITVIPEIDLPGHSSALLAAYPELSATGRPREVPLNWNVADGVISIGKPEVSRFVDDVLAHLIALFPGPWIHWGGDEVFRSPWMNNAQSLAWMRTQKVSTAEGALAAFWRDLANRTLARGKIPIGWDETVVHRPPAGSIIQWWDTLEHGLAAMAGGWGVISSWKWNSYFDYPEVLWDGDRASWMPLVNLDAVARHPFAPPGATRAQAQNILGLEATLFTERVTAGKVDRKLFPRLALFSESAWRGVKGGVPGWEKRLQVHRERLVAWGVGMFEVPR